MKKLKQTFLTVLLLASSLISNGQSSICAGVVTPTGTIYSYTSPCTPTSTAWIDKYSKQDTYIPGANSASITLKITLHIFTKDDGTAAPGFWESNPLAVGNPTLLASYLSNAVNDQGDRNSYYRIGTPATTYSAPITWIYDSKIRYEVTNIYYYPSSFCYTNTSEAALFSHIQTGYPGRLEEGLPILMANNNKLQLTFNNGLPAVSSSLNYWDWIVFKNDLLHEIGHCLGLGHTYQDHHCGNGGGDWTTFNGACGNPDYLTDVFPAGQSTCGVVIPVICPVTYTIAAPSNGTCSSCYEYYNNTNNIMGPATNSALSWTSPLQMGRRIRNMRLAQNSPNNSCYGARFFAKDAISDHVNTWNITANETWDFDIQMYEDIVVRTGKTLTIKCKVAMANDGKIRVEKGAKLVLDGGEITGWCKTGLWTGIEIDGTSTQNQSVSGGYGVYQGYVNIINGGTVSNAEIAVNTGTTDASGTFDWSSTGGIIIAYTANFINNRKDVQFMYYTGSSGNLGSFTYCNFKTNSLLKDGSGPDSRMSLYEVNGVAIRGCSFEYNAGSAYSVGNRGTGINSVDASYTIDQQSTTKTQFVNLNHGVYVDNTNPLRVVSIKNTNFYDVTYKSTYFNTITTPVFEYNYVRTSSTGGAGVGLYLNNCTLYNVNNNTFLQNTALYDGGDVGIYVNNSQSGAHKIYRNSFANFDIGIGTMHNNSGVSNNTTGLKMNCNDFTPIANAYDIAVMGTYSPTVMKDQGVSGNPLTLVRNKYAAASTGSGAENKWYIQATSVKTINHPANSDANMRPTPQPENSDVDLNVTNSGAAFSPTNCPATESTGGGGGGDRLANINSTISNLVSENVMATAKGVNPTESKASFELQAALAEKLNYFLLDTLPQSKDSVITLLQNYHNAIDNADVLLTYAYINKGDFNKAQQNITAIAAKKADWANLQAKLIELYQSPKHLFDLNANASAKNVLENYAATEGKDGRGAAQAILKLVNGQNYFIPHLLPLVEGGVNKSIQNPLLITEGTMQNTSFNVYPNPANTSVNFIYKGKDELLHITLSNTLGTEVYKADIKANTKLEINIANFETGVYLLTAYNGKLKVYQTKVMCIK